MNIISEYANEECLMVNESFVMRGKGGETLQRLIGAIYACSPDSFDIVEISNMRLKQYMGDTGSGKADKEAVARGVMNWFRAKENCKDAKFVEQLMLDEKWDEVDSIALAIAGGLIHA